LIDFPQLPAYYATNIAYDYSTLDPWGANLAPKHDVNPQVKRENKKERKIDVWFCWVFIVLFQSRVFTYGTEGHCAAVSYPSASDPQSIKNVRAAIAAEISRWVVA
jgi:hypothetical protein